MSLSSPAPVPPSASGIDLDLARCCEAQARCFKLPLDTPENRAAVREFYLNAVDEDENEAYLFRFLPQEFNLEKNLSERLDAFSRTDQNYSEGRSIANLKLFRRIAFGRCAFQLAEELNRRLVKKRMSWLWLHKDFLLPRIPLALAVGYTATLSLPYQWFLILGGHPGASALLISICCLCTWFLIFNNVRDEIGDVAEAKTRATIVFFGAVAWSALFLYLSKRFAEIDVRLSQPFHWPTAILIAAVSLLVAVVVQFFFAKKSIADPL